MFGRPARVVGLALTAVLAAACSGSDNPVVTPPSHTPVATRSAHPSSGPAENALARFYDQHLDWSPCHSGFECSTLRVPLDYEHPGRRTIGLRIIRLRASGDRIGSLLINPGGPGASGVDFAVYAPRILPSAVRSRFDIVGFDPRGVGSSAPIHCADTAQIDAFLSADPTPDTAAERAHVIAVNRQFVAGCEKRSGRLLPYMSTPDAARDMDVLRGALGDRKLTYAGFSYGTYLGAWYAELFPHRVRALLLDGALDPALSGRATDRIQAEGFDTAFRAYLQWCVTQDCPLGSTYAEADQRFSELIARVDREPLPADGAPADDGRRVGEGWAVLGVAAALYSQSEWPDLSDALRSAEAGDGSKLLELADELEERGSDSQYTNLVDAYAAVNCLDHPEPRTLSRYFADVPRFAKVAPHFGPLTAIGGLTCGLWPVLPTTPQGPLHAAGAPPILVIGTTRDPATPYRWAVALARELDSGVLLTHVGDGHTVYGRTNACVNDIGTAYLIDRKVPKPGTVC